MKKTLIVTAHPSTQGFTYKIAKTYKQSIEQNSGEAFIMDLYNPDWKQDFLAFENMREIPEYPHQKEIQEKILWANEIIFISPLWWVYTPAILTNFFSINFSSGFAFKYDKKGKPNGLLGGKKAKMFITCDGPKWMYMLLLMPFRTIWWANFTFCGIKMTHFRLFDKKRKRSDAELTHWLDTYIQGKNRPLI